MDLNELLVFARVAEAQSFTKAGQRLGMPKSTVSLKIARLEERLGVRLLHRTTRKLGLTEEGAAFYERCRHVIEEIDDAERSVRQEAERPRGHLKITAPVEFGIAFLGSWVAEYLGLYPEVSLEIELTSRIVDLVEEGFDLAIRAGSVAKSSHIARRLGAVGRHLYASPDYLARRGTPSAPDSLETHACLGMHGRDGQTWTLLGEGREIAVLLDCALVANSFALLRDAAIHDLGIAMIPDFICREAVAAGRLVRILPDWAPVPADIFVVYPTRRLVPPRVRSFLSFIEKRFAATAREEGIDPPRSPAKARALARGIPAAGRARGR